jgi:hypothetical protein
MSGTADRPLDRLLASSAALCRTRAVCIPHLPTDQARRHVEGGSRDHARRTGFPLLGDSGGSGSVLGAAGLAGGARL